MMQRANNARVIKRKYVSSTYLRKIKEKKLLIIVGILAIFIIIFSLSIITTKVIAEKSPSNRKFFTSVKIEKGDSLWSIASEYVTDEYDTLHSYIKEIKKSNGLTSDTIHEGCYIIVPYYVSRN